MTDAQLGQRIRALRHARRWTQQQLADRMTGGRIHRSAIAKIEAGDRPLLATEAITMAAVFGITPGALLSGEDTAVNAALDGLWQRTETLEAIRDRYDAICRIITEGNDAP